MKAVARSLYAIGIVLCGTIGFAAGAQSDFLQALCYLYLGIIVGALLPLILAFAAIVTILYVVYVVMSFACPPDSPNISHLTEPAGICSKTLEIPNANHTPPER